MENLPLLPGYHFSDRTRTNFIVPRTLSFKNGHRIIQLPRYSIGQIYKPNVYLTENERQLLDNFQPELIYGKVRVHEPPKYVPPIVFYDKKVLRFYGYFEQIIYESPLEYYRIRRVIIYYYLEDNTIAIYEIPYENSALIQGMRVRRHQISKNNQNDLYNWRDLNLGENLIIYGTIYRICDCDQFTREWLESEGIEVKCSELIPLDSYTLKLMKKIEIEKQRISSNNLKNILSNRLTNEWIINNKQFNNINEKILKFYAILDNSDQQDDILRKFIIHLYLIDNTIEIREIHQINDGYDPIGIYLHRQIVPKDSTYNIKSFVNLFITKHEQQKISYLQPKDFILGHHITIFNHVFFLYDCDVFTKNFYHQNFTTIPIQLPPISSQCKFNKPDDTIQTTKNSNKNIENDDQILRYEAIMDSPYEIDHQRRFLIVYRLTDDLISVYEKLFDGYRYLTKQYLDYNRIPKLDSHPNAPIYYERNDFYIGAHLNFYKYRFIIINIDHSVNINKV